MYAVTTANLVPPAHLLAFPAEAPSEMSLHAVFQAQPVESFAPGRAVFWEGDRAEDVFTVTQGVLRFCRILPDGRRAIVGFMFAGDLIGLSFRDRYLFTAEAVTDVGVRRFSRSRFHALVDRSPELRPQLLSALRDEMCAAQDQMLLLIHRTAEERVASFLLSVVRKAGKEPHKGATIHLPMSRTDIADYLGLTIETVCRSITKLKTDGLIALNGPHRIVLQKPRALKELAGEDGSGDAAGWRIGTAARAA